MTSEDKNHYKVFTNYGSNSRLQIKCQQGKIRDKEMFFVYVERLKVAYGILKQIDQRKKKKKKRTPKPKIQYKNQK